MQGGHENLRVNVGARESTTGLKVGRLSYVLNCRLGNDPTPYDKTLELVLAKGNQERELLSLIDRLRRVSGVREVTSVLDGSVHSKN